MKLDTAKLKELWGKLKEKVGKVSKKIWIILTVVLVLIAAGITIFLNTRPYAVLITGATPQEVTTVVTWLEEQGVTTYRYQGTDTILVPERQAAALKGSLLTEMYSTGTSDFSGYFDKVSMLSTEKERSNAWEIAVMEHMEAVICSMDGVQDASVLINFGEDRTYVLDNDNVEGASASVKVTMRAGKSMTSKLASAIRAYISGGVQGLSIDKVSVMDSYGNQYNITGGNGSEASTAKFQAEEQYANYIRTQVMEVLRPFFGDDGVKVGANVEIEWGDKTVETHDTWIPDYVDSRRDGKGIIGSEVWSYTYYADDDVVAGGLVGASTNSDIVTDVEQVPTLDDTDGKLVGNGQIDYQNPYSITKAVYTAGRVTDCTVSVSIDSTRAGDVNMEGLRSHVATAVGITAVETQTMTAEEYLASKISIYSAPFYREQENPFQPDSDGLIFGIIPVWVLLAAVAGLLLIVILLIVLLVVRAKRKKKKQAQAELEQQQSMEELLAAVGMPQLEPVGADVMSLQTEKSMELRQDIRQFAEENPEVAAQLIKSWLRGGDENA